MISVFTLPNGQQIIGRIVEESEDALVISFPLLMIFANPMSVNTTVYTTVYRWLCKWDACSTCNSTIYTS